MQSSACELHKNVRLLPTAHCPLNASRLQHQRPSPPQPPSRDSAVGLAGLRKRSDHDRSLRPQSVRRWLQKPTAAELNMRSVIETGARYLLDPQHKHHPTLVTSKSAGRPLRIEFLRHAVDMAATLGSDCVSLWSGALPRSNSRDDGFRRLVEGLRIVLDYAERRDVQIGFEPEPGMLIDTMASFAELVERMDSPRLGLTLDIGHLHCLGEPIEETIFRWSNRLVNIHLEDMRAGVHEHLMFGEGEMNFAPVLAALQKVSYAGGLHVELSRHSHMGPEAARQASQFLKSLIGIG